MPFPLWFTVAGAVLVAMALTGTLLQRLPVSTGLIYLVIGLAIGPLGVGLLRLNPIEAAALLERVAEVAVLVSLFAAGLKLRAPTGRRGSGARYWSAPVRLATVTMVLTIGLVAAVGVWGVGLPLGAAVLLGAVLAPTDPVLASDVSVEHVRDRDRLRFALTGEAGLNDGAAFPFVMLGLGLLGVHELGPGLTHWLAVDVLWAVAGGLGIGALLGWAAGRLVLYLRQHHREAVGTDDFLALGLIGLAYGLTVHAHAYGFIAVFAAGVALRRTAHAIRREAAREDGTLEELERAEAAPEAADPESVEEGEGDTVEVSLANPMQSIEEAATQPDQAAQVMVAESLRFTERLDKIGEVALMLIVGATLLTQPLYPQALWFVPLLLLVIRPLAVYAGLAGAPLARDQKAMAAWFGVRGIGSLYYLAYSIEHDLPQSFEHPLMSLVLWTITVSVVVHGVSVTPLMMWYRKRGERSAA